MESTDSTLHILSDIGLRRKQNEDCAAVIDLRIAADENRSIVLLVVADGMGGCEAGEVASRIAVQSVIYAVNVWATSRNGSSCNAVSALDEGFRLANRAIIEASCANAELRGMGTTMTAVLLQDDTLTLGHVGDTRAYLIGEQGVVRLSRDHSVVQEKVDAGILTPAQARISSERNRLTRALGVNDSVTCDVVTESVLPGESILLCSDGLHNSISDAEIASEVLAHTSAKETCECLLSRALQLDGSDNITIICKKIPVHIDAIGNTDYLARNHFSRKWLLAALLGLVLACVCLLTYVLFGPVDTKKRSASKTTLASPVTDKRFTNTRSPSRADGKAVDKPEGRRHRLRDAE